MPEGLEATIKCKVRRRLRDIGYRVMFPEGEPWADVVECFAIASLDRVHRSFGEHPWFWVVAWPGVIGAAAADFWEEIGTPITRRAVASAATAAHLEALLVKRALGNSDVADALPAPAVLGLRAIGQSTLPALPARALPSQAQLEAAKRLSLESEKGKSAEVWQPPPLPPPSSLRECLSWTTASLSWCKTGCPTLVSLRPMTLASSLSPTTEWSTTAAPTQTRRPPGAPLWWTPTTRW